MKQSTTLILPPYILLSAVLFFSSIASCTSTPEPPPQTPNYTILAEGQHSGFTLQKTLLLESTNEFIQLWAIHTGSGQTPVPVIDFKTNVVVASFLGEQRTGGYSIQLDKVIEGDKDIQVLLKIKRPAPGSMRTMQITQPFVIFTLSKAQKPVIFKYSRKR